MNVPSFENHPGFLVKKDGDPCGYVSCRWRFRFPNGYGASVITGSAIYADKGHPFELAVLHHDALSYSTPITNDVLGYQTEADILETLDRIAAL